MIVSIVSELNQDPEDYLMATPPSTTDREKFIVEILSAQSSLTMLGTPHVNLTSVKFHHTNYLVWREQVLFTIIVYELDFIDPHTPLAQLVNSHINP